jgi:PAB1-binding protein PBP1
LDIPVLPEDTWTIVKFDPVDFINRYFRKEFSALGQVTYDNLTIREVTIWSTVMVRGIFVTNTNFTLDNLPKEMCFKTDGNRININYIEIPEEVQIYEDNTIHELDKEDMSSQNDVSSSPKKQYRKGFNQDFDQSLSEIEKRSKELFYENKKKGGENLVKSQLQKIERDIDQFESNRKLPEPKSSVDLKEMNSEVLKKNVRNILNIFRWKILTRLLIRGRL